MKWAVGCRKGSELTLWFYEVEALDAYCAEIEVGKHYPDLRCGNEKLSSNCEALEDKLDSIEDYAARMRKQLKGMDFEGKGKIEAILSDIEGELGR